MKTKLLVVALLLCCFMVGLGATFQAEASKKWEYQFEHILTPERANQLGEVGWELVTATPAEGAPGHYRGAFKRARR